MATILLLLATFVTALGVCFERLEFDHCPRATLTCKKSEKKNEYSCVAFANQPSNEDIPQYSWEISAGKIVSDPSAHRMTMDPHGVTESALVVTLRVRWPKSPRACDATVTETINLR